MKYCPECGTAAQNSEIFCSECGERFPSKKINLNLSNTFAKIASTILTTSKKIIAKAKSDESKASIKKLTKNKKVVATVCSLATLLLFVIIGSLFINQTYSPKSVVKTFKNAILKNDINALNKILYSRDSNLEITDGALEYLINYFNSNNREFDETLTYLQNDITNYKEISYEGSQALLDIDEVFALTIKEKNWFFTKYGITIKPVYISISSNYLNSNIFINDKDYQIIDGYADSILVGPLLPSNYTITLKSKDLFDQDISETINVNPSSLDELYYLETYPLEFFTEYSTISIDSNVPEATIFVNGNNTGIQVQDTYDDFGPLNSNDKIYLSININGTTYKTEEKYAFTYYGSLTLNFAYSDYYKIAEYIEKNPNAFNNNSISETTDSDSIEISSIAQKYIDKYSSRDYIIPSSDTVELDFKALNEYTSEELFLARNEILARHGYVDSSHPNLVSYFKSKSWYQENSSFIDSELSEVETYNYNLIKSIEFLKSSYSTYPSISSDYVFANSDTIELTASQVSSLNNWELIVARNEIYARYGLHFSTKELLEHFKSKSWFTIDSSVNNNVELNSIEYKNVTTILNEENRRMESSINHDLGE